MHARTSPNDWTMLKALPYFEASSLILVPNIMIVVLTWWLRDSRWEIQGESWDCWLDCRASTVPTEDPSWPDCQWCFPDNTVSKTLLTKLLPLWGSVSKPKDIEKLHGIEFYYLIQANESIEQFGITVQRLGNIPSLPLLSEKVCNLSSPFDWTLATHYP